MKAKQSTGPEREPTKQGQHRCRVIGVYDMGTSRVKYGAFDNKRQIMTVFEMYEKHDMKVFDKAKGEQPKVQRVYHTIKVEADGSFSINWELSNIGKDYAAFLGEERLKPEWRKEWDFKYILGKSGNIVVQHEKKKDGSLKEKVTALFPLEKDTQTVPAKAMNPVCLISIEQECVIINTDGTKIVGSFPDVAPNLWPWVVKAIMDTDEYEAKWGKPTDEQKEEMIGEETEESAAASSGDDEDLPF